MRRRAATPVILERIVVKMEFLLGNPYSTPVGQCIGKFITILPDHHINRVDKGRVAFVLLIRGTQVCAAGNPVTLAFSGHHRSK